MTEVQLPFAVDRLIEEICVQKFLPLPDATARRSLSEIDEKSAIDVLKRISLTAKTINNLNGYILYMVKKYGSIANGDAESIRCSSPQYPSSPCSSTSSNSHISAFYGSPTCKQFLESPSYSNGTPVQQQQQRSGLSCSSLKDSLPNYVPSASYNVSPYVKRNVSSPSFSYPVQTEPLTPVNPFTPNNLSGTRNLKISQQSLILSKLEFRKLFMVHSYIGCNKLEDAISVEDAVKINYMKNKPMFDFEEWMWSNFGRSHCQLCDRAMYLDWDCGKTHLYTCHVSSDGGCQFKGPYLDTKKTHLQRAIGDENVLIVRFAEGSDPYNIFTSRHYEKIAESGILVGLSCYRLFVFKDGSKERHNKNGIEYDKKATNGSKKCYFIRRESIAPWDDKHSLLMNYETIHDVRCLFMHVHMVPTMAKYIARFSLILSTTIKLQVDLSSVTVEEIDDIPCIDENGCIVRDEDGEPLIQTDGTGFISEDLAVLVPKDFNDAKYMKNKNYENFDHVETDTGSTALRGNEMFIREPPLLIQCRLFHEGSAVKGTLLVNKKLGPRTIQVRKHSMIKVKKDPRLCHVESFDSLEVVSVSHKPKEAKLSKYLIALLSIGGVPDEFFLEILERTLKDTQRVCVDPRAAFRVANIYQHIDDGGISLEMFGACIPLNEPYFQHRLTQLAKEERKGLGEGKLPISDSFYLIGTTDPTGILNRDEVCVVLENGQISGKVLVYRNPGLHFGDIHVLNACYVKELEDYIGNSRYGIFFSTKGKRSVANEIATGDFDGDLYWVSKNHQLLQHFKPSEPWTRSYSTPNAPSYKPSDFSSQELERELFRQLFSAKTHSIAAGITADNWLAFVDRYLILQDNNDTDEKYAIKNKMLKLIDLYYDALDAPKTGKKVNIPKDLIATRYPHHMGRQPKYHSTSILGLIYDAFQSCKNEKLPAQEIWKLPYFNRSIPNSCLNLWAKRYDEYRRDMSNALIHNDLSRNDAANSVNQKYKKMLYGAPDFKDTTRNIEHVYDEALAIYHVTYDYAKSRKDIGKCGFAWKVAGSALCAYHRKRHCMMTGEREITFVSSAFNSIF
ncbi:probable RNA-dependent RNA polymerase 5 [Rutidosis leptorrhynchoides]|uniref:probable RNA-dependent RNA polymerase 5 n=1 Tax=Rutidosis leptorrhynchoides TaxID=125765 RepID=UPI003A9A3440